MSDTIPGPITTRFDLFPRYRYFKANRDAKPEKLEPIDLIPKCGVQLRRAQLWQVPDEKQAININGNPYLVLRVGWALDEHDRQYAYVEVEKAKDFSITMPGPDGPVTY